MYTGYHKIVGTPPNNHTVVAPVKCNIYFRTSGSDSMSSHIIVQVIDSIMPHPIDKAAKAWNPPMKR